MKTRIKFADLFFVSVLALYFEILFIRWFPANIQIIAYFTNLILISAFLGLGLGCLLADKKYDLMPHFSLFLLVLAIIGVGFSRLPVSFHAKTEHLLGEYIFRGRNWLTVLLIIFTFNTLFFIVLGQTLGRALRSFRPLAAYSINIAGSICGVILFWLLSYSCTPPIRWFIVGAIISIWFIVKERKFLASGIFFLILTLCLIGQFSGRSLWSPYYRIDAVSISDKAGQIIGYEISANQTQHQYAFDFSKKSAWHLVDNFREIYKFPYNFVNPEDVLVIGAGSGNDVMIALDQGAKTVDAVEIDPVIADMGSTLHPQKPYLDKRVNVFIDDARSYLNKTDKKYDLIVFGYLDAHRLLSGFSTVRLDNFIYTVESFKEAKRRLNPDGMLVVTYRVFRNWIAARLQKELEEVFGDDLIAYEAGTYKAKDTVIFFAGPAVHKIAARDFDGFVLTDKYKDIDVSLATDDWPYLYLAKRSIPQHYAAALLCMLILSVAGIYNVLKDKIRHLRHYHFFFLGAAFMLLETKSITRFALLYGSTWVVNTTVITSILFMILLANFVASKIKSSRSEPFYILLTASIVMEWYVDTSAFLSFNRALGLILSSALLALPLFFAGIIFAQSFKNIKDPTGAFGFNLAGIVLGGILEYSAMLAGFKMLSFLALAMYAVSYVSFKKKFI